MAAMRTAVTRSAHGRSLPGHGQTTDVHTTALSRRGSSATRHAGHVTHAPATWTCRAPTPVTSAAPLVLRGPRRDEVRLARARSASGASVWRCTGGQAPPFAIEARDDARGSWVTRPNGVPFGRLEPGRPMRPRLDLHDHARRRARIRRDGRVVDETRRTIARMSRDGDDIVLEVEVPVDDTLWALLIAGLLHVAGCLPPPPPASE